MFNFALTELALASWQTIYMVYLASVIGIAGGLILGCLSFATQENQALANKWVHRLLGLIINVTRSTPFVILMICLIPLTHLLIGTTIGTNAAVVPLSIAGIPFFARITANALSDIPQGLLEASDAMGVTHWQLLTKILLPESTPTLIRGATLTIIGLIGYSAMAGVVGGGGLGELAVDYGYQRFNLTVMLETVIVLVVLVQLIQIIGDYFAKKKKLRGLFYFSLLFFFFAAGLQAWPVKKDSNPVIKVGVMSGWQQSLMQTAQQVAKNKYHLTIQVVPFSDYVQPNVALVNNSIDANIFQHQPYLNAQIKAHQYNIKSIGKTFVYPMGFYSTQIHTLSALPNNALIALPNDPSNQARALLLLQTAGLIRLQPNAKESATLADIIKNDKQLRFITLDAAQLPRSLNDVTMAAITNDYLRPAGLSISDAILKENSTSSYANIIAARADDKRAILQELVAVMHSPQVYSQTQQLFPNGAAIKAW